MMRNDTNVRRNWLRAMYGYTFLGAGGFGLSLLFFGESGPFASQDLFFSATLGCFELAVALVELLGLRDPLKFAPLLVAQLVYKVLWFAVVFVPLLLQGQARDYTILAVVFATFIVVDLISIPFAYIFAKPNSE